MPQELSSDLLISPMINGDQLNLRVGREVPVELLV